MCGILGWAGPATAPFSPHAFRKALDRLAHRGPDDQGVWQAPGVMLGHRRLSIIDLSQAGHQPMHSTAGASVITFNGEIYNYLELRDELARDSHAVAGGSDTAVLLELLELQGPAALQRLNGMWAFGYWDVPRRQLLLARDRFGVKPLYYRHGSGGLMFASEPKALLALDEQLRAVDEEALLSFLAFNNLYSGERSFYHEIKLLPPAHYAVYDAASNRLQLRRYWDYPTHFEMHRSAEEASEEFGTLFEDAVRVRLRSDVPVGVTLSGGLDSTAVLTAASNGHTASPHCFTSVYSDTDRGELEWAERAAAVTGALITAVPAPREHWMEVLPQVAWHMDGPGYSPAVYPLWCLMKQARANNVPVLLEGQGADEALGGYPWHGAIDLLQALKTDRTPAALMQRLRGMRGTFTTRWLCAWMLRESVPALVAIHRARSGFQAMMRPGIALPEPVEPISNEPDRLTARLRADHSMDVLPGLLHYGDAVSMAHSIESRHPFMDYRLVEWLFRLPSAFKINQGQTKWVLREYLRSHRQTAIGNRRDKQGYPTPAADWLTSGTGLGVEDRLVNKPSLLHQWIDPSRVSSLFAAVRRGDAGRLHHLYKLVSTQVWLDRCIEAG